MRWCFPPSARYDAGHGHASTTTSDGTSVAEGSQGGSTIGVYTTVYYCMVHSLDVTRLKRTRVINDYRLRLVFYHTATPYLGVHTLGM